jgi:hypothetical protein
MTCFNKRKVMTRGIANTSPIAQKLTRKERRGKEEICILVGFFTVSNGSDAVSEVQVGEQLQ